MTPRPMTLAAAAVLCALVGAPPAVSQPPASVSLDEMEGDVAARWRDVASSAKSTLEADDTVVKEGRSSGRWDTDTSAQAIYLAAEGTPTNWDEFGALEMWVHSVKATGAVFAIALYSENPETDGEDYYRCLIPVDWEGWRFLHLEPRSFAVGRRPLGWRQIDTLRLAIAGWNDLKQAPGTVLHFDALRLVRVQPDPQRRLLFDPDTDWCAWWPLPYATAPTKTGRYVSDWYPAEDGTAVANQSVPRDWSGSVYLNLWLYCDSTQDMTLSVVAGSDREDTPEHDGYESPIEADWVGWRLLSLPLSGFHRRGNPLGWQSIDELRLAAAWARAPNAAARLCLDDVWLSTLQGKEDAGVPVAGGPSSTGPPVAPTVAAPPEGSGNPPAPTETAAREAERLLKEALQAKRQGDLELAFTKYIAVLLANPGSVEAHWGLAWVLAAKGEKEAASEHFAQVIALSGDPVRVKEAKAALARLKAGR